MILELANQFLDCLFTDVIVFLDSRMRESLDPEVLFYRDKVPCTFHGACHNDRRTFSRRSLWCPGVHNSSSSSVQFFTMHWETDTF